MSDDGPASDRGPLQPGSSGEDAAVSQADAPRGDTDGAVVRGTAGSLLFVLVLWLMVLYAVVTAFDFHPSARILPHIAGFPTLLVATILVAREVAWGRQRRRGEIDNAERDLRSELESFGWFAGYTVGVFLVGFAISSTVFMVAFLRLYGRESWRRTLLLTIGVVGIIVGVFDQYLRIAVYEGWLLGQFG